MQRDPFVGLWFALAGLLLVALAVWRSRLHRLPLTTPMLYLGVGVASGPLGLGLLRLHPLAATRLLEHVPTTPSSTKVKTRSLFSSRRLMAILSMGTESLGC